MSRENQVEKITNCLRWLQDTNNLREILNLYEEKETFRTHLDKLVKIREPDRFWKFGQDLLQMCQGGNSGANRIEAIKNLRGELLSPEEKEQLLHLALCLEIAGIDIQPSSSSETSSNDSPSSEKGSSGYDADQDVEDAV